MPSTRDFKSPGIFAEDASTTIPPTPIAGVAYRDAVSGADDTPNGWRYGTLVESQDWNQIMFLMTSILGMIDTQGVLGWSSSVDYTGPCVTFGSDGELYVKTALASGPNNGGAQDPVSSPAYWQSLDAKFGGRLIAVRRFEVVGASTYTPTTGTRFVIVEAAGGGGGGGGAAATAAGTVSVGTGGSAGSYAKGAFYSAFSGVTVTVGAAGAGVSGLSGTAGGTSSFGALITAPGGPGSPVQGPSSSGFGPLGAAAAVSPTGANIEGSGGQVGAPGFTTGVVYMPGTGGSSAIGAGGTLNTVNANGGGALGRGAGGAGAANGNSQPARSGGAGGAGLVIVWEYA